MAYKGSIEPKLGMEQQMSKPLFQKFYKYKVTSHYADDRNDLMRIIIDADPEAIIKAGDSWHFRVKTRLTYAELFKLLLGAGQRHFSSPKLANLRKVWWF